MLNGHQIPLAKRSLRTARIPVFLALTVFCEWSKTIVSERARRDSNQRKPCSLTPFVARAFQGSNPMRAGSLVAPLLAVRARRGPAISELGLQVLAHGIIIGLGGSRFADLPVLGPNAGHNADLECLRWH